MYRVSVCRGKINIAIFLGRRVRHTVGVAEGPQLACRGKVRRNEAFSAFRGPAISHRKELACRYIAEPRNGKNASLRL